MFLEEYHHLGLFLQHDTEVMLWSINPIGEASLSKQIQQDYMEWTLISMPNICHISWGQCPFTIVLQYWDWPLHFLTCLLLWSSIKLTNNAFWFCLAINEFMNKNTCQSFWFLNYLEAKFKLTVGKCHKYLASCNPSVCLIIRWQMFFSCHKEPSSNSQHRVTRNNAQWKYSAIMVSYYE